jgi:hypothetical protein
MLAWRIEQQGHWRQAESVLGGRQPARDPDREPLVNVADRVRVYVQQLTRDGGKLRLCKRLVNVVWEPGTIEESRAVPDDRA